MNTLDHLSVSSIKRYQECPKRWAAEKLDGRKSRWGVALVKGRAVDAVATANWGQKAKSHQDMPLDDALALAENTYRESVEEAGGRKQVDWGQSNFARALDSTISMADVHMRHHAPLLTPAGVQVPFRRSVEGGYDVIGFIDAVDQNGDLIDVKTGRTRLSQRDANLDLQATGYSFGVARPVTFRWMRVIDTGASVSSEIVVSQRPAAAGEWFEELVRETSILINAGAFPARVGWQCSSCVIADLCVGRLAAKTAKEEEHEQLV